MCSMFNTDGTREVNFLLDDDAISLIQDMWKKFADTVAEYPLNSYHGKGIVICAGGISYFTCAWVLITHLRVLQCELPIEVWYKKGELTDSMIDELTLMHVDCCLFDNCDIMNLQGVGLKPLAILRSKFSEVLYLDADNNCLRNPTYLFNSIEYKKNGAIFWPDYWFTAPDNPIWKIVNNFDYTTFEQESGQLLINKEICWHEINLCLYFNRNPKIYYRLLYGDKDTFRFAWLALQSKFHMISTEISTLGYHCAEEGFIGITMIQHDINGEMLFLHRNLRKWNTLNPRDKTWEAILRFELNDKNRKYYLCNTLKNRNHMKFDGDFKVVGSTDEIRNLENECFQILVELSKKKFFQDAMCIMI